MNINSFMKNLVKDEQKWWPELFPFSLKWMNEWTNEQTKTLLWAEEIIHCVRIFGLQEFPSWLGKNPASIHENRGLIPGLFQWIKDPALPWAVV